MVKNINKKEIIDFLNKISERLNEIGGRAVVYRNTELTDKIASLGFDIDRKINELE